MKKVLALQKMDDTKDAILLAGSNVSMKCATYSSYSIVGCKGKNSTFSIFC